MDFTKRAQIRKMLAFLEFKIGEHLFMQEITLADKSWPSLGSDGIFYSNFSLTRRPLLVPPNDVVAYAHNKLMFDCKMKIASLAAKHRMPLIENLLIKFYKLEFCDDKF